MPHANVILSSPCSWPEPFSMDLNHEPSSNYFMQGPDHEQPFGCHDHWAQSTIFTCTNPKDTFNIDINEASMDSWRHKNIKCWETIDVMNWITHEAGKENINFEEINMPGFRISGLNLYHMSEDEFISIDSKYGLFLYKALEKLKGEERKIPLYSCNENQVGYSIESEKSIMPWSSSNNSGWMHKNIEQWENLDIMNWIIAEAQQNDVNYEQIRMDSFGVTGQVLYNMSESDFDRCDPDYGRMLYKALNRLKGQRPSLYEMQPPRDNSSIPTIKHEPVYSSLDSRPSHCSDGDSDVSEPPRDPPVKRPGPGRPPGTRKRKPEKKCGRLWEFIRDLLLNREYCPSLICWENHDEGIFRFVRSDKVAELWGTIKENPKMTYEKLSRAMRYYYKSKVLQPVLGRRLVYKFGPTATGWQTKNPNFRLPID